MIKKILKKIIWKEKSSSEEYIKYLRKIGVQIGEDNIFYAPKNTVVDEQYPWMISIGNHVRITSGVIMLTHDYAWSVLKRFSYNGKCGNILGASGRLVIGDNVFIGMNSILLRGTIVGKNVIIGAGSVVSGTVEENSVYAGNPARKIMTIEEFYEKRMKKQLSEAKELARNYVDRFGEKPDKSIFHEYFFLFSTGDLNNKVFKDKIRLCKNEKDSLEYLNNQKPYFENFEEFLDFCMLENPEGEDV